MEGGNANGCNSQEPLPLYKALNEPFHATSRSPNSITNQAWLQAVPVQSLVGFWYCSWGAFPQNHGAGHGKMVEAVHFFTKQALSASGLRKYKICFFSACKFAKFAKFTISTSHRFPRQSELWRREKLCTPDRLTEVFLSSVQEWLNGFGFQRSPLDIFQ
jgi:hypothetical protein